MTLFHLALVALVQGVTEFLPVSSSGHLVLIPLLTGLKDQGLSIDIAAHAGSLGAVLLYFRRDVVRTAAGIADLARGSSGSADARLAICLGCATIPVVIAGGIVKLTGLDEILRSLQVIGLATLGFGIILYWADKSKPAAKPASDWNLKDAAVLGLWQVFALIPGASRSGVTMTAARICGYGRRDAARLSMLMSIPVIAAASLLTLAEIIAAGDGIALRSTAIAAALSFAAALAAVAAMMELLKRFSFTPFVIYRVILGAWLLAIAWS